MGMILHDWNLDRNRQLIRAAYDALPEGGAFIAYDAIIDDDRRHNSFGLLMSLNMLIETPAGFADPMSTDPRNFAPSATMIFGALMLPSTVALATSSTRSSAETVRMRSPNV